MFESSGSFKTAIDVVKRSLHLFSILRIIKNLAIADDDALYILPPTHTHASLRPSSSSIVT